MYLTTKEVAQKWGIDTSLVLRLAREGRIEGAVRFGKSWMFPENAEKPIDRRRRSKKAAKRSYAKQSQIKQDPAGQYQTDKSLAKQDLAKQHHAEQSWSEESQSGHERSAQSQAVQDRVAQNQTAQDQHDFRFPLYVNFEEHTFSPSLTNEEKQLRQGQLDYYACRFAEAEKNILPLCENAKDQYVRIAALYYRCFLSVYRGNGEAYNQSLAKLREALAEDFPFKRDMMLFSFCIDRDFGYYKSINENFRVDLHNPFHPTSHAISIFLSLLVLGNGDYSHYSSLRFDNYELCCIKMEQDGLFLEAQELHFMLVEIYQMQANKDMIRHHMHRGLEIGLEHELYLRPAITMYYYPTFSDSVLAEFPEDFAEHIRLLSIQLRELFVKFSQPQPDRTYWSILSDKEFVLLTYALQGYSNKQIGKMLSISEKAVSKRYSIVYDKLNISSKQELVDLIVNAQNQSNMQPVP